MNLDNILTTFPPEVRESPSMKGLVILFQTLHEQLQKTQENLTKAQEKILVLENEIARLRKTPKRPKLGKNRMEPRDRKNGSTPPESQLPLSKSFLSQKEFSEVKIKVQNPPAGSRFKGYQSFSLQDICLVAKEITYKLEVWLTPSGDIIRAELPKEAQGSHYGSTLRALATNLYAQGMTQPGIHEFFCGLGIEVSAGQINHILLNEAQSYAKTSETILTAGLQEAPYIRVDDTGDKHKQKSSYCTHVGGEYFAYYKTAYSKSRENFLKILLQGKEGYLINESMIWHLFQSGVEDDILNLFEEHIGKAYGSKKGINRLLNQLGIVGKKIYQQCVEAALVGFISQTILKKGQVLLSDRAGQFAVFDHAGCWIHMERPLRKIIPVNEQVEKELTQVRNALWTLYRNLKNAVLTGTGEEAIHKQYDELVQIKTTSPAINAVIANFASYREEMLKALDHPGLPLHNNDSERDIRGVAKRRNISGSTKSEDGRCFRDGIITLKQTCFRLGYNFWDYLQRWFRGDPPDLAELVRNQYRASAC